MYRTAVVVIAVLRADRSGWKVLGKKGTVLVTKVAIIQSGTDRNV
jgi:hypothetical protein